MDDVISALVSKRVDGILLDSYVASDYAQQISEKELDPVELVHYPRYYGAVLSGQLANIANLLHDNLKAEESRILKRLDKKKIMVGFTKC